MALTTKESVPSISPTPENTPATQDAPAQMAPRTDPIGIEIPVVVHASRYSATTKGLSKSLPPVHEETRTVIVFAQGAVVRLSASLSLGETVVLTNQQTGADALCRVASVKAQPGIQNYVDLEFTQRAPGFWNRSSNTDAPVRSVSAVQELTTKPDPAPKTLPAVPAITMTQPAPAAAPERPAPASTPAPAPCPVPSPSLSSPSSPSTLPPVEASSASPKAALVEQLSVATLGAQPELAAKSWPAPKPARTSSSLVAGVSAGMRQVHAGEGPVLGGGLDWTKESPARSKKGLIAAITILAVAGLAGGAYVLTQRSVSEQPASGITTATPSAAVQPPQAQSDQPTAQAPNAVDSAPAPPAAADSNVAPAVSNEKSADTPRQPRRDAAPADIIRQVPTQEQSIKQTPPLRPAVEVGNLRAPVLKNAAISSSSEPPPTLSGQDNSATQEVIASGGLVGATGPSAPAPPVAFASPEPVKVGGQLQMPKLISSIQPTYPDVARAEAVQGTVVMDALIDTTGTVTGVKVTSGPLVLRQAAMDALRRWKYQPARLNGQPTSVHMNVSISFTAH
jgi:TonB family protein